MISQFHVISPRGDCIITREFRKNISPGIVDKFYRRIKQCAADESPIIEIDGVQCISVNKGGIYFLITTESVSSSIWAVDLLCKVVKVLKDFCGTLSEESLRRNFILVYELIDEMLDSGYPQTTASEVLKLSVFSDPVDTTAGPVSLLQNPMAIIPQLRGTAPSSTIPSSANQRPIGMSSSAATSPNSSLVIGGVSLPTGIKIPGLTVDATSQIRNEIFVDILERMTVVVDSSKSQTICASIDGAIQMKSYLSGSPGLRLCLNEDLVIAGESNTSNSQYSSSAILDDVIFHESADLSEFDSNRVISITPPDGEFVLMNYRIREVSKLPFRIYPSVETVASDRVDVQIAIRADLPEQNYGSNLLVSLPLPENAIRSLSSDTVGAPGSSSEHVAAENRVVWHIKKLQGGSEVVCRARLHLSSPVSSAKLLSPISLHFEVPMYSLSNVQVRYLRISEGGRYNAAPSETGGPQRWVRYVAQSQSYLYRL